MNLLEHAHRQAYVAACKRARLAPHGSRRKAKRQKQAALHDLLREETR
jgi:hypothetical protein